MPRFPMLGGALPLFAMMPLLCNGSPAIADAGLRAQLRNPNGAPLVVSHRACWMFAAENTLDGIEACIARGVDMVEVDVRTSADGELVLMHDSRVDRTTNGHGAVAQMRAAEILALQNHPADAATAVPGTRHPPTLAEALARVRGRVLINLDIKEANLDRVMDVVEASGAEHDVLMNVPLSISSAQHARAERAGIAIQPLLFVRHEDASQPVAILMRRALTLKPASVQLIFEDMADVDHVACLAHGRVRLFVNTMTRDIASKRPMNLSGRYTDASALINPKSVWGELRAHGVSVIQTDEPMALRRYLYEASKGDDNADDATLKPMDCSAVSAYAEE